MKKYLAVDSGGREFISSFVPVRNPQTNTICPSLWCYPDDFDFSQEHSVVELPKGSIAKMIGRVVTWEDEPIEVDSDDFKELL